MDSFIDHYLAPRRIRFQTQEVKIGSISLGGNHPIRIQSMTNTDTNDTISTVRQSIDLALAGCELVRITAQAEKEARNLAFIRKEIRSKGFNFPLIADIHFNPKAAETAAGIVEKVRINPGNYTVRSSNVHFTDKEYEQELEKISERILPLLIVCKQNGTAIRIGTNHGSLSSRIMDRYGDTPLGMVESALEFARICAAQGFHNLVLSMKSSNVRVMVQATRLLADRMIKENLHFPLHLGVTEAGDGEDGIIKSAAGIGALLEDGLGDTIRVSLTGDPLKEIPVAREIAQRYNIHGIGNEISEDANQLLPDGWNPYSYYKMITIPSGKLGGNNPVQVIQKSGDTSYILTDSGEQSDELQAADLEKTLILGGNPKAMRLAALEAIRSGSRSPLMLVREYANSDLLRFSINAAIDFGSLLVDSFGEAICPVSDVIPATDLTQTAFSILQATRTRITRTEYISCPSCGRTLFDIEKTLADVKAATSHLKGLRIAVMGCIVNGPGEMADADYGYVGAGPAKVSLYKGSQVALLGIPEEEAIDKLIELIKQSGDWVSR